MSAPFDAKPFYRRLGPIPPEHDVQLLPGFETVAKVNQRKTDLARLTRKRSKGAVILPLANCAKGSRCYSGACPACMRQFRRWLGTAVMNAIGSSKVTFVTVVNSEFSYLAGKLKQFDLEAAKEWLRSKLKDAGLGRLAIIGGIDFSFNMDADGRWLDHWRPHFALLVLGKSSEDVKTALEPHFHATIAVPRPVKAVAVYKPLGVITYLVKSAYFRRSSYIAKNGRRNTKNLPLRAAQEHELTLYLDRHQPTDRLFLQNIRIRGAELVVMSEVKR